MQERGSIPRTCSATRAVGAPAVRSADLPVFPTNCHRVYVFVYRRGCVVYSPALSGCIPPPPSPAPTCIASLPASPSPAVCPTCSTCPSLLVQLLLVSELNENWLLLSGRSIINYISIASIVGVTVGQAQEERGGGADVHSITLCTFVLDRGKRNKCTHDVISISWELIV